MLICTQIEVETENLDMVKEAQEARADIIMLDNMSIDMMEEAIKLIDGKAQTEYLAAGKYLARTIMLWIVWFELLKMIMEFLHGCLLSFISSICKLLKMCF